MDLRSNIIPAEVIKEGFFGGTYFRDVCSKVNNKWYKNSWNEFNVLKDVYQMYYWSNYCESSVNKYGVRCGTSLRFWENKGWINPVEPYGWFQWYFRY